MAAFSVVIAPGPGAVVVQLRGTMTFHDYEAADRVIDDIFAAAQSMRDGGEAPAEVVFDLGEVDMIDSHWLGIFVRTLKRAQEQHMTVTLQKARSPVRRLLDQVQFDRVFRLAD